MLKMIGTIFKIAAIILVVFSLPFIIPIFFKLLIHLKVFDNINEIKDIINVFNNKYTLIYIAIGIIVIIIYFHKWDGFKEKIYELVKRMKLNLTAGDKSLSTEFTQDVINESEIKKETISKIISDNKDVDTAMFNEEVRQSLGIKKNKIHNINCSECDKKNIENENVKLRNFAAYNMLNKDAKILLHVIYNEKFIEKEKFKDQMIRGYKRRNKKNINLAKKDINKIAQNKSDTIYDGLKFLNIIEPSEDDKIIKLTQEGKKFVEKYIEKEEVV
jgi:hypothetical protein